MVVAVSCQVFSSHPPAEPPSAGVFIRLFLPPHLALMRAFFQRFALVGFLPRASEAEFHFYITVLQADAERHEHAPFFLERSRETFYFFFREQEPPRAVLFVVGGRVLRLVGRDMGVHEPCFAAADENAGARDLHAAAFRAFHLLARELDPGFACFRDVVIEPGPPVFRDGFHRLHYRRNMKGNEYAENGEGGGEGDDARTG